MSDTPDLRIGDADREQALQALGEHMSAGRLTVDEYGERSAKVAAAKTRNELTTLFADLPEPHPKPAAPWATVTPPSAAVAAVKDPNWVERPVSQRLAAAVIPLLFVGAVLIGVTTGFWWLIALPFVTAAAGRAMWGQDWERERRRNRPR